MDAPGRVDEQPGQVRLAPGIWAPDAAFTFTQVAAGGPGGQHANKTATKVELRLPIAAIVGLTPAAGVRLELLAASRAIDGEIRLVCDETRSARQNRSLVIERLCELVLEARIIPKTRRPTKPSWGSRQRRLEGKSRQADRKRDRRPGDET